MPPEGERRVPVNRSISAGEGIRNYVSRGVSGAAAESSSKLRLGNGSKSEGFELAALPWQSKSQHAFLQRQR